MVLDEPTSALDPVAEAQLYRDFTRLTGNRTTLLISHRLGITAVVDRSLVFQEGKIVDDGSHRELMEKNGGEAEVCQCIKLRRNGMYNGGIFRHYAHLFAVFLSFCL